MTPAEIHLFIESSADKERQLQKEGWRRTAFLAAAVINYSGYHAPIRRPVKPKDLITFLDEKSATLTPEYMEKRKREAAETLRLHKAKFWMLINDESVKKICGDN